MNNMCEDDKKAILEHSIEEGLSLHDVALKFGVTKSTIRRWALKHNLTFKTKSPWRKN
ncbi:MAG: hypothetical protein Unbinned4234contig1002_40 [Prokaryotic dsDNA virus sp.]|nr:MAG: hypothetical protein Unbinned4234contig1002_40 [Prokaryotic dsDNA virus sp.]